MTVLANYTFSKTLSDSWETAQGVENQIASCRNCDKGPVSYDIPQQFVTSVIYDLPFGRGRMFGNTMPLPADMFLGWRIGDITTLSAGSAFTVTSPNNTGDPESSVRGDRLCSGKDSHFSGKLRTNGFVGFHMAASPARLAGKFRHASCNCGVFGPGTDFGSAQ